MFNCYCSSGCFISFAFSYAMCKICCGFHLYYTRFAFVANSWSKREVWYKYFVTFTYTWNHSKMCKNMRISIYLFIHIKTFIFFIVCFLFSYFLCFKSTQYNFLTIFFLWVRTLMHVCVCVHAFVRFVCVSVVVQGVAIVIFI